MDLEQAVNAHMQWRVKLRAAIAKGEQLDAAKISTDNNCDLGKWLKTEGSKQFGSKAEFQALVESHRHFHQVAGQVASAANAGKKAEAEALLNGRFQTQSNDTVTAIRTCKKACQ